MTMSSNGNYDDPDDDCEKYYFCVGGIAYPAVWLDYWIMPELKLDFFYRFVFYHAKCFFDYLILFDSTARKAFVLILWLQLVRSFGIRIAKLKIVASIYYTVL